VIVHEAMFPPVLLNVILIIGTPRVRTTELVEAEILATGSRIVRVMMVGTDAAVLFAQMVKVVEVMFTVGAPVIEPLLELKASPAGRLGWIDHESTIPPVFVMLIMPIWMSLVNVEEDVEGEITAAGSMIVTLMSTESEPPVLFAQIVH